MWSCLWSLPFSQDSAQENRLYRGRHAEYRRSGGAGCHQKRRFHLSADQYTLSPTLLETVGQQTITVTFGQLTATFEVTVREDIVTLETTLDGWHHPRATPA